MSLDAKVIGLLVWKIIRFSACCSYKFVRKYSVVSGVVIFVVFVYICFPSFFYILLYASPILVCIAIFIRFYWKIKRPKAQVVTKKDSDEISLGDVNRSNEEKSCPAVNKSIRHQKSVRRNARMTVLSFNRNDSPDLLFSKSIYDILPGKSNLLEEDSGLVSDANGSSNVEHGESSSQNEPGNDQALHEPNSLFDNDTLKPPSESGDSFEGQSRKSPDDGCCKFGVRSLQERENTKEGEVKEDRNKAVERTKDDEKNLMDLGLTEMERNKRLESLIAKRRERNMFKMAIEKIPMDKGIVPNSKIAPILIVKNNILGGSSNPNEEGLPMPGSAPSILLPTHNPFDLPYDPFEEKPNLTADSFQQEFIPANKKETLFCRHESFSYGPLFTFETSKDRNNDPFNPYYSAEKKLVEGPAVDNLTRVPDDEGCHHQHNSSLGFGSDIDLIEIEESNDEAMNSSEEKTEKIRETADDETEIGETRDLSGSEVMEIDSIKNNDSCSSASSSDDSASGIDQTTKPPSLCSSQVRKTFNLSIPPKGKTVSTHPNDSSPSPRRAEFNLFYNSYKRHSHHTRNCSIASDLQVEVSEVDSPTLLTDGTISPVEGDSVTYDGDVERDVTSDGEELWGGSFNLSRETNREKLRELDYIIEEDYVAVKLSGLNMNELVLEDTHGKEHSSINSSKDESKTLTSSNDTQELSKPSGESNPDSIEPIGGSERLIEYNTRTDPSKSKKGNAKSNDPKTMVKETSAAEVDRICNVNDSSTDKVTKNGSSTHVFDGEDDPPMLSRQKVVMEPSKTSGKTSAGSVKDTEHESKRLTEVEANAELSTSTGVSKSLNNTKNGGDIKTLSGQERVSDALQSREDILKAGSESISGVDNNVTDILVDHKIAMEASKLKESEVKAVNTKNGGDIQTLSGQECV